MHRLKALLQKKILILFLGLALFFGLGAWLLDFLFPLPPAPAYSTLITDRRGEVLHAFLSHDDKWRMKTELSEIIPDLRKAIIHKEDRYFYVHPGVNPIAIVRALGNNLLRRKTTSGASTITMQVARLMERYQKGARERSYGNKLVEMCRALQLEWYYSKDEILQLYLNLVPYGGNVEGVKSAALLYFGRLPNQLSLAQITALAIIPNRPTSLYLGRQNGRITVERNKWLRKFGAQGVFATTTVQDALAEPLEAKRTELPHIAPHLAYRLKRQYRDIATLLTTLDRGKQDKVQQLAYNYHRRLRNLSIYNLAVLVVNNRTHQVEAYVGSPDFTDLDHGGQVDGIRAIRSPGSTLKPLVYATAFDEGQLTPKTVLTDVPTDFHGYQPENYDQKFNGKVTVEKALTYSLNIPAVKVLDRLGLPLFIKKLKQANFRQIQRDESKLGLSVILGGCGVTLEELTNLYSAFANQGRYVTASYIPQQKAAKPFQVVSTAAAFVTTEMLTQAIRPDLPNNYQSSAHVPKIAWKTGTSYGRRDAWSIGYNATYTVGVWVGNFTGDGVRELSGADIATPLLFHIFNSIDYNSANQWFSPPKDLKFRLVCSETGKVPNHFCDNQVVDYFLPLVSSPQPCDHLQEVTTAADESFSYCTSCRPEAGYAKKLFKRLSPELIAYYESEGISYQKIPAHNPRCTRVFADQAPAIVSPAEGREYLVDKKEPPQLMLAVNTDHEVKLVYWYINDKFYKTAKANEKVFFTPGKDTRSLGSIKISCSDDKGRNSDISIKVVEE
ncbi:MAG: penicillin-binding protein 1C [Bacteroidota bacterium]